MIIVKIYSRFNQLDSLTRTENGIPDLLDGGQGRQQHTQHPLHGLLVVGHAVVELLHLMMMMMMMIIMMLMMMVVVVVVVVQVVQVVVMMMMMMIMMMRPVR